MPETLYTEHEDGSVEFRSERRVWDVSIPAYVYDLWMPLIGSDVIGVFGVYCRLERYGKVRKMSLEKLARKCRIGKGKLAKINGKLVDCGFIRIEKPEGWKRLAHFTTTIITLDPPMAVAAEMIEKYGTKDYEPLCPWLVEEESPDDPNGSMGSPEQVVDDDPNGSPNIESSLFESLTTIPTVPVGGEPAALFSENPYTQNRINKPPVAVKEEAAKERVSAHPLTKKLIELNGGPLSKEAFDNLGSKIRVSDSGVSSIYPALVVCYDTYTGFADFIDERIKNFEALWKGRSQDPDVKSLVKNLRNFNQREEKKWPGWLKWKELNTGLVNQKALEKQEPVTRGVEVSGW